ncbi:MAG: hypothetical protein AB7K24_24105 [Gemmataceae bacterium]
MRLPGKMDRACGEANFKLPLVIVADVPRFFAGPLGLLFINDDFEQLKTFTVQLRFEGRWAVDAVLQCGSPEVAREMRDAWQKEIQQARRIRPHLFAGLQLDNRAAAVAGTMYLTTRQLEETLTSTLRLFRSRPLVAENPAR